MHSAAGQSQCKSCEDGFYADGPGRGACVECAASNYTGTQHAFCELCPAGKVPTADRRDCEDEMFLKSTQG